MNIVQIFDPTTTTSDTFTVPTGAANGKMVVWNESNISLQFAFQDGSTAYVPAWCATIFCGRTGSVNITWQHQAILSSFAPPLSQVVVEIYAQGEQLPGQFPMALNRQTNTGNVVSTVSTAATNVINDGNIANTSVVEATPLGDATSAVQLNNIGQLVLGNATHPGSISTDNAAISSNGSGTLTVLALSATTSSIQNETVQSFLANGPIQPNNSTVTLFGSTAGTVTLFAPFTGGSLIEYVLVFSGFRNGGAGAQTLSLPTAITTAAQIQAGALPNVGVQFLHSAVAQTITVITALASAGGTGTGTTTLHSHSIGEINAAIDTISFPGSASSTITGTLTIRGV